MQDVRADPALWASSMCPEGILERWRVTDGTAVAVGAVLAELRIEGALHEIVAPGAGRLVMALATNALVEPGTLLGSLTVA